MGPYVRSMERVEGVLATPDGYWRVEVVRDGRRQWYRVWYASTVVEEQASIATVERVLGEAFGTLQQVDAA